MHKIEEREGYKTVLIDDTSGFCVVRDFKEDREGDRAFKDGDYVRVFGVCKKGSKYGPYKTHNLYLNSFFRGPYP